MIMFIITIQQCVQGGAGKDAGLSEHVLHDQPQLPARHRKRIP